MSEDKITATADMRIEVVRRELNHGALAGFDSSVTEYAARLVVAALDTFDEEALKAEFRRGFELGDVNGYLRAITLLRDTEAKRAWLAQQPDGVGLSDTNVAADYLEAQEKTP